MAGTKRKQPSGSTRHGDATKSKKLKSTPHAASKALKAAKRTAQNKPGPDSDDIVESDTTESENGFYGFSAKDGEDGSSPSIAGEESDVEDEQMEVEVEKSQVNSERQKAMNGGTTNAPSVREDETTRLMCHRNFLERSPCEAESFSEGAQSCETKRRLDHPLKEDMGAPAKEVTRAEGRAQAAGDGALRDRYWQG